MRYIKSYTNDAAIQAAVDDKSLGKPYIALDVSAGTIDWNGKDATPYLTIEATGAGNIVVKKGSGNLNSAFYRTNGSDSWTEMRTNTETTIPVQNGDRIAFKGSVRMANPSVYSSEMYFSGSTASFVVYGNIMSLFYGDDFAGKTEFPDSRNLACYDMFRNCTGLTDASNLLLPATTLGGFSGFGSYASMFQGCINLIGAPSLPATTLGVGCYRQMFRGCTSLTTAPELPSTTLVSWCYADMFQGCTGLASAPILPAPTLPNNSICYANMFNGCANLNYAKCIAEGNISFTLETQNWLANVSPTGTFVKKAGVNWPTGANGIPSGWTVIEE